MPKLIRSTLAATGILARTALKSGRRHYPAPLASKRGTRFSSNVFTAEIWAAAAKQKRVSAQSFLAVEALGQYIRRMDNLLDAPGALPVSTHKKTYQQDPEARRRISVLVKAMRQSPLSRAEQKEAFAFLSAFRKEAFEATAAFERKTNPTLEDVIALKRHTSGAMGRVMTGLLNRLERIPKTQAIQLEKAMENGFLAGQLVDDIRDIQTDHRHRIPNFATAVLRLFPDEQQRFSQHLNGQTGPVRLTVFKKTYPKTYAKLRELGERFLADIPTQDDRGLQTLVALPRVFWRLALLARR